MFKEICAKIQAITGRDVGSRGMAKLVVAGDLEIAGALFAAASSTVVLTGFPCRLTCSPPTETDGPSGAAALALGASRLGAPCAIAVDDSSSAVLSSCARAVGLSSPSFELLSFPPRSHWTPADTTRMLAALNNYQHAIAVERAGVAIDGTYRTMRAKVMDEFVAPLDVFLTAGTAAGAGPAVPPCHAPGQDDGQQLAAPPSTKSAHEAAAALVPGFPTSTLALPARTSSGIGDGGNECGMGKVAGAVREHITNGQVIACVTPADALVAAGVSNWGAWAVLAAAEAAVRCSAQKTLPAVYPSPLPAALELVLARPAGCLLPSDEEERALSKAQCEAGAGDGITGAMDGSVDGMPLEVHLQVLAQVRAVLTEYFPAP